MRGIHGQDQIDSFSPTFPRTDARRVWCLRRDSNRMGETIEFRIDHLRKPIVATVAFIFLASCADSPAIQRASSSKSKFDLSAYRGETVTVRSTPEGVEEYRVFQEGSSGFVSIQSVRTDAEQRATAFCGGTGKTMLSLRETTAKPPYILGNFPRVEIIFGCVDPPAGSAAGNDSRYKELYELKKLLDTGVLTQQEFEREKAKILNQP
jgi:Short C-terminal domain